MSQRKYRLTYLQCLQAQEKYQDPYLAFRKFGEWLDKATDEGASFEDLNASYRMMERVHQELQARGSV